MRKSKLFNNNPITYFDDFDALRGIAALLVVLYHIAHWLHWPEQPSYDLFRQIISFNWRGGNIGVTFFFVLSGFLISYLMFRESQTEQGFRIGAFYWRRILRIWPLYFLTLLIGFVIYPGLSVVLNRPYVETANGLYYLFFLTNFDNIINGYALGILGVQWSVAIEEQFYLLWPVLFLLLPRKWLPWFVIVLLVCSNIYIITHLSEKSLLYYHPLAVANDLAWGCLFAYICFYQESKVKLFFSKLSTPVVFSVYVLGLLFVLFVKELSTSLPVMDTVRKPLIALFFVFVLLEQSYSEFSFFKLRRSKWLSYLGKISYGIYLLHMVAVQIVLGLAAFFPLPLFLQFLAVLFFTCLLSHLSYTYFESWFLKLKKKI